MEPPDRGPLLVHIGSGAVTCLALDPEQQLWCGCGNAITILSSQLRRAADFAQGYVTVSHVVQDL